MAGYLGFVLWLGIRLIVLVSGGVIVGVAIVLLVSTTPASSILYIIKLATTDIFLSHTSFFDNQIPAAAQTQWRSVQQQAQTIQQIAVQIAQREPTFIPDLLETLHTVLDLIDQLVQALQIISTGRNVALSRFGKTTVANQPGSTSANP